MNAEVSDAEKWRRLYEAVTSNTPDLVHVFDLNYRFTYANEALLRMWGRTWETAIGKRLLEIGYEPWHAEMHEREIDQVIATKQPVRGEVPFTGTNGRRIYDYIFVPVLNDAGEVEAVAGTTRDVTDRKAAEDALRNKEEELRLALKTAQVGTWLYEVDGGLVHLDERMREILGEAPEPSPTPLPRIMDRIHPDDRPLILSAIERALSKESDGAYQVEYRYLHPDGSERWLVANGQAQVRPASPATSADRIVGTAVDITERRRARAEAERQREQLYSSFMQAPVPIGVVMGDDLILELVNPLVLKVWGRGEEVVGKPFLEALPDVAGQGFDDMLRSVMRNGESITGTEQAARYDADGDGQPEDHFFNFIYSPLRNARLEIDRVMFLALEVTDQVLARRAIEAANEQLREANQLKDEFLSLVSHELRTPLTMIRGNASILARRKDLPEEIKGEALNDLLIESERLTRIVENMLVLGRMEAGQEIEVEPLVASKVLARSTERFLEERPEARIILGEVPSSGIVFGVEAYIDQILYNLFSNALKYSPPGSPVHVSAEVDGEFARIAVADRGRGVQHPEALFTPFSRESGAEALAPGLGLGLAVCKRLVEAQGGVIRVEARPGGGSVFSFTLPLHAPIATP